MKLACMTACSAVLTLLLPANRLTLQQPVVCVPASAAKLSSSKGLHGNAIDMGVSKMIPAAQNALQNFQADIPDQESAGASACFGLCCQCMSQVQRPCQEAYHIHRATTHRNQPCTVQKGAPIRLSLAMIRTSRPCKWTQVGHAIAVYL